MPTPRSFASDNYAGAHPEVLAAIAAANAGHEVAYGRDSVTARLQAALEGELGKGATVYPVFNGTGANVLALEALIPRWGAVVCAASAHVHTDEAGAPERVGGIKLLPVATPDGKLTPELLDREAWGQDDEHRAQPVAVTISQPTELGTVYTPEQLRALTAHAHSLGMRVHLDGARLANAAASLGCSLAALTSEAGVDVVSLGGTKNGALGAEAVVVLERAGDEARAADLREAVLRLRKMSTQLGSKTRFVSAQLLALYEGDLWRRSAAHANAMARRLADGVQGAPGVEVTQRVEANAVFVVLPAGVADALRDRWHFYDWDRSTREVRWMCSFDTTEEDVDALARAVHAEVAASAR